MTALERLKQEESERLANNKHKVSKTDRRKSELTKSKSVYVSRVKKQQVDEELHQMFLSRTN